MRGIPSVHAPNARRKHTAWEQGTHVPLIVRYPKKRDYVVACRDRLDTCFEMVRGVRDKRYRYQRASKAITGEANYYRWGSGASESPMQ